MWGLVLPNTPRLCSLDLSCNLGIVPGKAAPSAALLQQCAGLRDLYFEPVQDSLSAACGDAIIELQRQVPRVRWRLTGAPSRSHTSAFRF